MSFGNRFLVSVVIGLVCLNSSVLRGQGRISGLRFGEKDESDLKVSTGLSIGLGGPEVFYNFQLVDENGFAYDTWSLVTNPQVVAQAGITKEQLATMTALREEVRKELILGISKVLASDEGKAELKQRFLEAEVELLSVMEPEQLDRFEQAKDQANLAQVGLEKFLNSKAVQTRLGLAPADVESIITTTADLESRIEQAVKGVLREANLELINELSRVQVEQFEETFADQAKDEYLQLRLISGNATEPKLREIATPDLLRMIVRSNTIRGPLELRESQHDEITALKTERDAAEDAAEKAELDEKLAEILDSDQYRRLMGMVIQKEAARWGTVNALCGGSLGRMIGLSEEDRQRLFELGLKIHRSLPERNQLLRTNAWKESLGSLPEASRDQIMSMLGATLNPAGG